jgi:hypothetical protein
MNGIWNWTKQITVGFLILALALITLCPAAGTMARSRLSRQNPPPGQLVDFSILWSHIQLEVAGFTRVCSYHRAGLGWSEASPNPRTGQMMVRENVGRLP